MHEISAQEWDDYLEGKLSVAESDRIEAHLMTCLVCWRFYQQMVQTTQALSTAGREVQEALRLREDQLHAGLQGVLTRLQAARTSRTSPSHNQIQQRLDALATVMAPMCGSQTAHRALHAAAQDSPAKSLERVTDGNWEPFLKSLTSIAAVMCGKTGASLVWESGQL